MNPIENVWHILKNDLWMVCQEEAERIDSNAIKKLFLSLLARINALKKNNFDFTKY